MDAQKLKTILKFDVGADGFQKMMYVLAIGAAIILIIGVLFLNMVIKEMKVIS
ncbi:MAG: hypothetical protein HY209_06805 [Candidatus Omnitrophica bacterium]|nr:hypothetical protein [Candidatus Omnitrophota bacterium]